MTPLLGAGLVASAADVDIDALGGVIPNSPSANVRISSAAGSGEEITLAADSTKIAGLVQAQSSVAPSVRFGSAQTLTLSSISILSGMSDLTLGFAPKSGTLMTSASSLALSVPDEDSLLTANVDVLLGGKTLAKTGLGRFWSRGEFCGTVSQVEGTMVYSGFSGNTSSLMIEGSNLSYDFSSAPGFLAQLTGEISSTAGLKPEVAVVSSSGQVTIRDVVVAGGSQVKIENAILKQVEVADEPYRHLDSVADCMVVGTNSIGLVRCQGTTLVGKLAIGGGNHENAKGAFFESSGSVLTSYCSTNGEYTLGRSGFAHFELSGGRYMAAGLWYGGQNGQLGIVITNGTFAHTEATVRPSGFELGGANALVSLYVGGNGVFDASGASKGVYMPARTAIGSSMGAQFSIVESGLADFGSNRLQSQDKNSISVNNGGTVRGAGADMSGSSMIQFDGGIWHAVASKKGLFAGEVFLHAGNALIEVDSGAEVKTGDGLKAPTGKGVTSIAVPADLAAMEFIAPPLLKIEGGAHGHGATAVCRWDATTRKITGIEVTGRGTDYVAIDSVGVYYGGYENPVCVISGSEVTLEDNPSGGLVKLGEGTLVLTGDNTYTGVTEVVGGRLVVTNDTLLHAASGLKIRNSAVVDFCGMNRVFSDLGGDGTGSITNGTITLKGLRVDFNQVKLGVHDKLSLEGVEIAPDAALHIQNLTDGDLDRSQEYVLYEFVGDAPYAAFPIDDATYSRISQDWAAVVKDGKMVLRYIGGSLFIYY